MNNNNNNNNITTHIWASEHFMTAYAIVESPYMIKKEFVGSVHILHVPNELTAIHSALEFLPF